MLWTNWIATESSSRQMRTETTVWIGRDNGSVSVLVRAGYGNRYNIVAFTV